MPSLSCRDPTTEEEVKYQKRSLHILRNDLFYSVGSPLLLALVWGATFAYRPHFFYGPVFAAISAFLLAGELLT